MRAIAVIGANFGDEGKGAAVDALAAAVDNPLVIRFCGGAQAGHTVVTPQGQRHVFSHFGSGTFAGALTYLGPHFVVNPELFLQEHAELAALGLKPKVIIDPDCRVTLPSDVHVNRWKEDYFAIGGLHHGSCGIGFGEAIERGEVYRSLRLHDLIDRKMNLDWFLAGAAAYAERRLKRLRVPVTVGMVETLRDPDHRRTWIAQVQQMLGLVSVDFLWHLNLSERYTPIFEGAQGLMLDQDSRFFPHVTRSWTGLRNVVPLAKTLEVDRLDVYYMSRPYLTRHGAGPLPDEGWPEDIPAIADTTNVWNKWQETLRFAPFNAPLTKEFIERDLRWGKHAFDLNPMLGFSCVDQIHFGHTFVFQKAMEVGLDVGMFGIGPTRTDRTFEVHADAAA